jgi:hypothetical protein
MAAAGQRHSLTDLLTLALCGVICGADGWTEIEDFSYAKEKWFRTFLELTYGIPSHDTFGRVFAQVATEAKSNEIPAIEQGRLPLSPTRRRAVPGRPNMECD